MMYEDAHLDTYGDIDVIDYLDVHAEREDIDQDQPDQEAIEGWLYDGGAETTDGCWVEPDGTCEHGNPSWLIVLNMI